MSRLRPARGDQELSEQGEDLVLPESELQPEDAAEFYRRALLLLGDIRDTNARICAVLERLLPNTADDPRYKQTGSWR